MKHNTAAGCFVLGLSSKAAVVCLFVPHCCREPVLYSCASSPLVHSYSDCVYARWQHDEVLASVGC
jgi:hypothetical protein